MKHTSIPKKKRKTNKVKNTADNKKILKRIPAHRRGRNSQRPRHCIDILNRETRSDVLDSTDVHIVAKGGSFKPLVPIELRAEFVAVTLDCVRSKLPFYIFVPSVPVCS